MNPNWLILPEMVSAFAGGYYLYNNTIVGIIFIVFAIMILLYKWKLEDEIKK